MNTATRLSPTLPVPERSDARIFDRNRIGSQSRELGPTMAEVFARIRVDAPRPQLPPIHGPAEPPLLLAPLPLEDPPLLEPREPLELFEAALERFEALEDPEAIALCLREIIVQAEGLSPSPEPPPPAYPRIGWSALMPAFAIAACALSFAQLGQLALGSILRPDLLFLVPWAALILAVPAGLTLVSVYFRWRLVASGLLQVGRNWRAGDVTAEVVALRPFHAILALPGEGRQVFPYHLATFYPVVPADPGDCSEREFALN